MPVTDELYYTTGSGRRAMWFSDARNHLRNGDALCETCSTPIVEYTDCYHSQSVEYTCENCDEGRSRRHYHPPEQLQYYKEQTEKSKFLVRYLWAVAAFVAFVSVVALAGG